MIKRNIAKINIRLFFIAPSIAAVLFITMCILDPMGVIHPYGIRVGLSKDMRQQAAGVLNIMPDTDSIILGTSMLENTSAREAEKLLGGTFANISISGSSFYERSFVLEKLLKTGRIKTVIYSLDGSSYISLTKEHHSYEINNFDYLYNENLLDNILTYRDFKIFRCVIKPATRQRKCMQNDFQYDRPNEWASIPEENMRFGGLEKWFAAKNNDQIITALSNISNASKDIDKQKITKDENINTDATVKYIQENLIRYVRDYPEVQFHLIFPPYSRITFAQWYQRYPSADAQKHKAAIKHLAKESMELKNLHVYGFENMDFLDKISNYKDTSHYHQRFNSMMLEAIRDNTHTITSNNVDAYINIAEKKAKNFDLVGLGQKIDAYLETKKAD